MPNTTPTYGWPWPLGTDRVMDGDDAMGNLAKAVEATLKLHPGFTQQQPGATFAVPQGAVAAVPGMSLAITTSALEFWLALAFVDFSITAANVGLIRAELNMDNSVARSANWQPDAAAATGRNTIALSGVIGGQVAIGAHTLEVRVSRSGAGTVNVNTNSSIALVRFPR